ncbi:fimbria/pilus outer membrane usher protein [Trabulsiella odontotermitis]|uniref:fimbria/pilus outer membrane usher protein n=2 Tax=Trabulsiella odontotermitis TaxID=379893 RepID=UPI0006BA3105|nr:fimbria/pilus outer membrane usher protein [Trabulsiella odontotermitis]
METSQQILTTLVMSTLVASSTFCVLPAVAAKFNPKFLENAEGIDQHLDLSVYEQNDAQRPGKYQVDIYVNDQKQTRMMLAFAAARDKQQGQTLLPCLTKAQLQAWGVRTAAFADIAKLPAGACVPFWTIIPGAKSELDFSALKLSLSFPQAAMQQTARGTVPENRWDNGIPALLFDYSYSGSQSHYQPGGGDTSEDSNERSDYLNLRSGFNLGPWRLRNNSVWQHGNGENHWDSMGTYLTRSLIPLKSQLTLGDTSTSGDIFDSLPVRGVVLASDDQMLPDSQRGFAPVIRGIAKTNAEVVVEQNGYVIYRRFVSPGQFEINDLYPTANSGDLTVTVKESDGSEQKFIQPYAAVAIMQREGQLKYSLAAGRYQAGNYQSESPQLLEATAIYGLPAGFTAYGGVLTGQGYNAQALGIGKNMGEWGALSLDATHAASQVVDDIVSSGYAWRLLYAKSFATTGTSFNVSGYRYSTPGFYTFQEATDSRSEADSDYGHYHRRSQLQVNLTQQLGAWGSWYVNATDQKYWQDDDESLTFSTGYNGHIGRATWSLAWSANRNPDDDTTDRLWSLDVSIPIGSAWTSFHTTRDQDKRTVSQVSLNGTLLDDHNLDYSVTEGYGNDGQGNSGSASLNYQGGRGDVDVGYNYGADSRQLNYSLRGGVIVHSGGVTLSQPLGETMALVSAPGAQGSSVTNNSGVTIDRFGNAVVPQLTPYRETEVSLRSETLNNQVDLNDAFLQVVPTRGAVVRASFDTRVGYRALLTLTRPGQGPVPFGATAALADDAAKTPTTGMVAEDGELYISGLPEKGRINVSWGKERDERCVVDYQLAQSQLRSAVISLSATCQSE